MPMKRRRAIQTLAGISMASALPLPTPAQEQPRATSETPTLETTVADAAATGVPRFFSAGQFEALERLSIVFMPAAGETPGAKEAGVAEFLDFLLAESPEERQALYRDGLDQLDGRARRQFGKRFADLPPAEVDSVLAPLREGWTFNGSNDSFARFLNAAKLDVMHATMNSREWSLARAKRSRRAGGLGSYWYPIE